MDIWGVDGAAAEAEALAAMVSFMESVGLATVFSPGWSWYGLFLAGSSELHFLQ